MISFLREGKDENEKRGNIWSVAEKGGKKGKEKKYLCEISQFHEYLFVCFSCKALCFKQSISLPHMVSGDQIDGREVVRS